MEMGSPIKDRSQSEALVAGDATLPAAAAVPVIPAAPAAPAAAAAAADAEAGSGLKSRVLSDVSFRVRRGETVAVVGPSGGGKSSLLKLLLKLYRPSAGQASWPGEVR
ncbi:unnamed protein product [Closterium sp. NIES-53]